MPVQHEQAPPKQESVDTIASALRIGHGYDIHQLRADDSATAGVCLAGLRIACPWQILAHSDGDVIIHALIDAIFGALALGDLGDHFPDNDPANRDRCSLDMLDQVCSKYLQEIWRIVNIDATLIAEVPRIGAHRSQMRKTLAQALHIERHQLSIKATTNEGLDSIGARQAIASHVVVLLERAKG